MSTIHLTVHFTFDGEPLTLRDSVDIQAHERDAKAEKVLIWQRVNWWTAASQAQRAAMIAAYMPGAKLPVEPEDNDDRLQLVRIEWQGRTLWPVKPARVAPEDKPLDNPFDTTPKTEAEAIHDLKVQATLNAMSQALANTRPWLTLQQLCDMADVRPVFEAELPVIDGRREGVFLFSIGGMLARKKIERALMGGHCILISAANLAEASRIAAEGLADTIRHAKEYAFADSMGVDPVNPNAGIVTSAEIRPKLH